MADDETVPVAGADIANTHDPGLFGPQSVTWRVHAHPVMIVGGVRALMVQALHPHAMAGVAEHSDYRADPQYRLRRTGDYVNTVTYGSSEQARAAGALVQHVHTFINGVDPVTGERYSAEDPETLLWVHCAEVHSFLAAYRTYGGRLSDAEADAYFAEQVRSAELIGIPADRVPASRAAMRDYFASVESRLCVSQATRETFEFLMRPPAPWWQEPLRPAWLLVSAAAVGLMPRRLRRLYGAEWPRPVDAATWTAVRAAVVALNGALRLWPVERRVALVRRQLDARPFAGETPRVIAARATA